MLTSASQPFPAIEYLLKESRKYQTPKLYVIDIAKVCDKGELFNEGDIRNTIDQMKFSQNRTEALNKILDFTNILEREPEYDENGDITEEAPNKDYYTYLFNYSLYHNSWKNLTDFNFKGDIRYYKGFRFNSTSIKHEEHVYNQWFDERSELDPENKEALMSLLNYGKTNNLQLLFVIPKRVFTDDRIKRLNEAYDIIKENGYDIINFNLVDDFDINFKTDLYNSNHLNVYGAIKYTLMFSKFLNDNYELPDHRGDKNYQSWAEEYERLKLSFSDLTNKSFDSQLDIYSNYSDIDLKKVLLEN